jgi:CO dehydrogenase maturation factor
VLAIDADPDANLAATLGFPEPETIVPISQMKDLVEERTGAKPGKPGVFFKLNPQVDDLPEKYAAKLDGIRLMVMGQVKRGGTGCYCAENVLLQSLVNHLLTARNEVIILDMEAGIEHLSRATANAVDQLIVVVEPWRRSIETAFRVKELAADIGLKNIGVVGNKVRQASERDFITANLPGFDVLGFIPYDPAIIEADMSNVSLLNASQPVSDAVREIFRKLTATSSA